MADDKVYGGSILQTTPVWKNEYNEVVPKPKNYKDNTTLDMADFYTLMAAQMRYQDVLNPESNTSEMMTSMVQMAMVGALQDLQTMTQTTYAASMMGKTVTVAETTADGKLNVVEGIVEGVSLYDGDPKLIIDGKEYAMSAIMQVGTKTEIKEPDEGEKDDVTDKGDAADKDDVTDKGDAADKDDVTDKGDVTDTTNKDNPNQVGEPDNASPIEPGDDGIKTDTVEGGGTEQA